ncbi:MAG: class I SAM-dependent methyltransferase [Candidatus Helarchaeota archaeon]
MALLPEDYILPEVYYTFEMARQYDSNSRIRKIQREMTIRALEILNCQPPAMFLDVGCGTGHSMQVVQEKGYKIKGIDIAESMLIIAKQKGLDVRKADFTKEIPFEANSFDYIISISTLQWIFHGFKPRIILEKGKKAMVELNRVLKPRGQVVIQFYPRNQDQLHLAGNLLKKAKFKVIQVIDNENVPKRKKIFLLGTKLTKK